MSTGQTLMALAAISLFMYTAVNVNRTHIAAVSETVAKQRASDAINFSQSISELLYAQGQFYNNMDTQFGVFNDVTNPANRMSTMTTIGDSLFATIFIAPEQTLIHGAEGRVATIRVFSPEPGGSYLERVSLLVTIVKPD